MPKIIDIIILPYLVFTLLRIFLNIYTYTRYKYYLNYFCIGIVLILLPIHETSSELNLKQLFALSLYSTLSILYGVGYT